MSGGIATFTVHVWSYLHNLIEIWWHLRDLYFHAAKHDMFKKPTKDSVFLFFHLIFTIFKGLEIRFWKKSWHINFRANSPKSENSYVCSSFSSLTHVLIQFRVSNRNSKLFNRFNSFTLWFEVNKAPNKTEASVASFILIVIHTFSDLILNAIVTVRYLFSTISNVDIDGGQHWWRSIMLKVDIVVFSCCFVAYASQNN